MEEHLDERSLARAVRAQDAEDLAGKEVERDVVDGGEIAEPFGQAPHLHDGGPMYFGPLRIGTHRSGARVPFTPPPYSSPLKGGRAREGSGWNAPHSSAMSR